LVTVVLGMVWTLINFYNYYPLAQRWLDQGIRRLRLALPAVGTPGTDGPAPPPDGTVSDDASLPVVDVLVPAYHEAEVLSNSIRSIYDSSYPADRLNVVVLLEPDDTETRTVATELAERFPFDVLTVHPEYPGSPNKPRALNYGFEHTDGDLVGIVDAEVIVGSATFHEAATVVREGADFVLSRLDMVNEDDGWLNLLFRAEYGYWYEEVIPAFAHVDYPIPLGGTSCFFRRSVLEAASEFRYERHGDPWSDADLEWLAANDLSGAIPWDPENITEDFELGLLLWVADYDFAYLSERTREESPLDLDGWISQRTRWKQGKLYTFLQYVEYPPGTLRQRFHLYWQSLLPHLGPINIAGLVFVFWLANMAGAAPSVLVRGVLSLGLAFMIMVSVLYARGYWLVSDRPALTKLRRALIVVLTLYLYWFLQWIADVRAILRTYRGRFDWEKTTHIGRNLVGDESGVLSSHSALFTTGGEADGGSGGWADGSGDTRVVPTTSDTSVSLTRRRRLVLLAGIVAIGAALRLYGLTRWSLWVDEIYTIANRTAMSIPDLLVVPQDPHPPLYFLLLKLWFHLAGDTRVAAGLLSVAFSLLSILLLYLFARKLYDDATGLVAAGILSVSTLHIHFGRNIRMYSLLTALALASWYAYVRLPEPGRRTDLLYVLTTVGMLYTHVYAVFVLAAQHVYTIITGTDAAFRRRWLRVQVVLAVLYSPWAAILGQQVVGSLVGGAGGAAITWLPDPSPALLRDTLLMYAGFPSLYPILSGSTVTWIAAILVLLTFNVTLFLSCIVHRVDDDGAGYEYQMDDLGQSSFLVVGFVVPIIVPFVVSYFVVPIYFPRYTLAASLPLYVLSARGLVNLRWHRSWQIVFGVVILLGAATTGLGYYTGESVEDWRGLTDHVEDDIDQTDLLVIQPTWIENSVMYYYDGPDTEVVLVRESPQVTDRALTQLSDRATDHDTVWIVRHQTDDDDVLAAVNDTHRRTQVRVTGSTRLYRFDNRTATG
jgi:cellulose synthase/poly-beta-1,6-N-acetylglucosamine synthase-like glycosyltransferase/4-amino-4-deoxy-L-arabinose transferase-like glycosyltransferase